MSTINTFRTYKKRERRRKVKQRQQYRELLGTHCLWMILVASRKTFEEWRRYVSRIQ